MQKTSTPLEHSLLGAPYHALMVFNSSVLVSGLLNWLLRQRYEVSSAV